MTENRKADIIKKIRALLNMSIENGCTENEAIIAAAKADELMLEYNLETHDIDEVESERWGKRGRPFAEGSLKRRSYHPVSNCHNAIAYFSDCKCYYQGFDLIFFGTDHGTEFAHYLSDIIRTAMDIEYRKAEPGLKSEAKSKGYRVHGKTLRTSFMLGMANRINERLYQMKKDRDIAIESQQNLTNDSRSLVVVKNNVLEQKFEQLGLNLVERSSQSKNIHSSSYRQGQSAGNNVNLGRPVDGSSNNRQIGN